MSELTVAAIAIIAVWLAIGVVFMAIFVTGELGTEMRTFLGCASEGAPVVSEANRACVRSGPSTVFDALSGGGSL